MKLPREIRTRIMAGECPYIGGEGIPLVKAGHTWKLSQYVTVTVNRIDRKKNEWQARYTVTDRRDLRKSADLFMRHVPRPEDFETLRDSFDAHGYPAPVKEGEADAASTESAYTTRADLAIDAAPVVPPEYQAKLAKEAEAKSADMRKAKIAEAQKKLADISEFAKTRKAKQRLRRIHHDLKAIAEESEVA